MQELRGIEPGDAAPDFQLPNANPVVGSETMSLSDVIGPNGAIIVFTCNHCPYVVGSEPRIEAVAARAYRGPWIRWNQLQRPRELRIGFVGQDG